MVVIKTDQALFLGNEPVQRLEVEESTWHKLIKSNKHFHFILFNALSVSYNNSSRRRSNSFIFLFSFLFFSFLFFFFFYFFFFLFYLFFIYLFFYFLFFFFFAKSWFTWNVKPDLSNNTIVTTECHFNGYPFNRKQLNDICFMLPKTDRKINWLHRNCLPSWAEGEGGGGRVGGGGG